MSEEGRIGPGLEVSLKPLSLTAQGSLSTIQLCVYPYVQSLSIQYNFKFVYSHVQLKMRDVFNVLVSGALTSFSHSLNSYQYLHF